MPLERETGRLTGRLAWRRPVNWCGGPSSVSPFAQRVPVVFLRLTPTVETLLLGVYRERESVCVCRLGDPVAGSAGGRTEE